MEDVAALWFEYSVQKALSVSPFSVNIDAPVPIIPAGDNLAPLIVVTVGDVIFPPVLEFSCHDPPVTLSTCDKVRVWVADDPEEVCDVVGDVGAEAETAGVGEEDPAPFASVELVVGRECEARISLVATHNPNMTRITTAMATVCFFVIIRPRYHAGMEEFNTEN